MACSAVHVSAGEGSLDRGFGGLSLLKILCLVVPGVPLMLRAVNAVLDDERGFHFDTIHVAYSFLVC